MLAYRFLTEVDTSAFCHKVTEALSRGWSLHGGPTYAFDPKAGVMRCGQAVVKALDEDYDPSVKLGDL
jgi:hypothetical protein